MTADPFGATPKAIGPGNYPVRVGRGTACVHGISWGDASDTHVIKKKGTFIMDLGI